MLYDFIRHIHFANLWAFLLLAILPFLIWFYYKKSDQGQPAIRFSTTQTFQVVTWKNRIRHLPFIFRLLTIVCLILVIARPQKLISNQRSVGEGIDIMLCMDVSGSMGSQDIPPSRMEVAKEVAATFVRSRPVDRIGLVIFSGESFTQCPITADKETLISQIENLESRTLLKDGTVIGEGLATAVDRISKSNATSKIIILITDGKEDAPDTRLIDPLTALEIAKARKIKVYTIGMGAMPTTIVEVKGRKPQQPQAAFDFIDEDLLKKIANETGGQYFRARDKQGLQNTYAAIDKLEKSKVEVTIQHRAEEKYLPFMLAALLFLFVELMLRFTIFKRFP